MAGAAGNGGDAAGGTASSACPADATFCSGFEDSALPTGAVYKANAAPGEWTQDFAVDSTVFHSGKSALRVKSSDEAGVSSSAYRMLAVPTPATRVLGPLLYPTNRARPGRGRTQRICGRRRER